MRGPATFGAHPLVRTADPRRTSRRRGRVILAMSALALVAAGVVGSLTHPAASRPLTGPFSYFPQ